MRQSWLLFFRLMRIHMLVGVHMCLQAFRYASNVVLRKDVETGRTTLEAASGSATRSPSPPLVVPNQVQSEESAGGKETPGPEKSAVEDAPGPIKKLGFFKHPVTVNALLLLLGSIPFGVVSVRVHAALPLPSCRGPAKRNLLEVTVSQRRRSDGK